VVPPCIFAVPPFAHPVRKRWVGSFLGVPMVDDTKRQHDIKLWLTDREFLDLSKAAEREDRKVGEMGRVIVRKYMYGNIGACGPDFHGPNSPEQGRTE
jgi:hypothetical protein